MKIYEKYNHHGIDVWVRIDLKGKHRDICLCFNCKKLNIEDREKNCPIANATYKNCERYGLTTPVTECPYFLVDIEYEESI